MKFQIKPINLDKRRWLFLAVGIMILITLSFKNLWSVTLDPIIDTYGATDNYMATIYTIFTVTGFCFMLIGGKCVDRFGPTIVIISAMFGFLFGMGLPAVIHSPLSFGIGYVIFLAYADQVLYVAVFANIAKLFPDKRGTTMAITSVGISLGGSILPPLCEFLLSSYGLAVQFGVMGILLAGICAIGVVLFPEPSSDYLPSGYVAQNDDAEEKEFEEKNWKGLLQDPGFYMFFALVALGGAAGIMIISQCSWLAQDVVKVTPAQGAWLVSALSVCMMIGKLTLGFLSDKVKSLNVIVIIFTIFSIVFIGLTLSGEGRTALFMGCMIVGAFAGGGSSAMTPVVTADLFGTKNFAFNFAIVMLALPIGQAVVPWIANLGRGGDFVTLFTVQAGISIAGLIIALILRKMKINKLDVMAKKK